MYTAEAPSNIALIKYMGKTDTASNTPTNPSLSYTLKHFRTRVEAEPLSNAESDCWEPLTLERWTAPDLSQKSSDRYLRFFNQLKQELGIRGNFRIRSANNFAPDCGLASSASSFAALTMVAGEIVREQKSSLVGRDVLAKMSQKGSGSSCRSFFEPWSIWDEYGSVPAEFPVKGLLHQAIMVGSEKKEISSSEAHKRVVSSLNFNGRAERARERMSQLIDAFQGENWEQAFAVVWAEFWDMHSLFETSMPPFGYMNEHTLAALAEVKSFWKEHGDGPLCTMDAGPNVHLLWRDDQRAWALKFAQDRPNLKVLSEEAIG